MLVLGRKLNQRIVIDGRIFIKVLRLEGDVVKLGIQAPPEVSVHREEIYDVIQRNKAALQTTADQTTTAGDISLAQANLQQVAASPATPT